MKGDQPLKQREEINTAAPPVCCSEHCATAKMMHHNILHKQLQVNTPLSDYTLCPNEVANPIGFQHSSARGGIGVCIQFGHCQMKVLTLHGSASPISQVHSTFKLPV